MTALAPCSVFVLVSACETDDVIRMTIRRQRVTAAWCCPGADIRRIAASAILALVALRCLRSPRGRCAGALRYSLGR